MLSDPEDADPQEPVPPGPHEVVWRYRRELAPLLAALALAGVAQWGHADHRSGWPWAALAGLLGTGLWCQRRALRPSAAYALTVGALATAWLVLAWLVGPGHRWLLVPLLTGALLAGVPWWDHQLPRPGLEADGSEAPPELRERVVALVKLWPQIAAAQGLAGVRLQPPVRVDRHGWQWRLRLPTLSRLTAREVIAAAHRLDKVFRVRAGATRLELDPKRADRLLLRVNVTNPLGTPIPYVPPEEPGSIREPLVLGPFEDGTPAGVVLQGSHMLLVGRTGSGKTSLQQVLLFGLLACTDAVVWVIDATKGGARFKRLEPGLGWLATSTAEARAVFAALREIRDARSRWRAETGHEAWPVSSEHPQLVVVVDEFAILMAQAGFDQAAADVAATGREDGISLVACSQRGTADELGGSVFVRTQCELRAALAMDAAEVDWVLDRGAHAAGYQPEHFTDKGMFYLRTPELRVPRPARGFLPGPDQAAEVVRRWAPQGPPLDAISASIAERHRAGGAGAQAPATAAQARLLALLDEAPAAGVRVGELADGMEGLASRSWVMKTLAELQRQGRAAKLQRGRWAPARPESRPELVVLDGDEG